MSLAAIFIGLALLMFLAFRGHSIIWVAPVCAAFVALCVFVIYPMGYAIFRGAEIPRT